MSKEDEDFIEDDCNDLNYRSIERVKNHSIDRNKNKLS